MKITTLVQRATVSWVGTALVAASVFGGPGCGGQAIPASNSADGGTQNSSSSSSSGSSSSGSGSSSSGASTPSASSDAGSAAACIAAGGKCIQAASDCPYPQDANLMNACGDPSVERCCVPYVANSGVGDAGSDGAVGVDCIAAGGHCHSYAGICLYGGIATNSCGDPTNWVCCADGPSDAGTRAGKDAGSQFACGATTCDSATQYCFGAVGGIGGDRYSCETLPAACAATPTCACFKTNTPPFEMCTESHGAVTVTAQVG